VDDRFRKQRAQQLHRDQLRDLQQSGRLGLTLLSNVALLLPSARSIAVERMKRTCLCSLVTAWIAERSQQNSGVIRLQRSWSARETERIVRQNTGFANGKTRLTRGLTALALVGVGRLLTTCSAVVAVLTLSSINYLWPYISAVSESPQHHQPLIDWVVVLVTGLAGVATGSRIERLGRRMRQPSAGEILAHGSDYVLLLRSFRLDAQIVEQPWRGVELTSGWDLVRSMLVGRSVEEPLVRAFGRIAPVIAVGRPGEVLPPVGAARLYLSDDEWQATVSKLAAQARVLVLVAGSSSGLIWEAISLVEIEQVQRFVLYVPILRHYGSRYDIEERNREWLAFRNALQPRLPVDLPDRLVTDMFLLFQRAGSNWETRIIRPEADVSSPTKELERAASAVVRLLRPHDARDSAHDSLLQDTAESLYQLPQHYEGLSSILNHVPATLVREFEAARADVRRRLTLAALTIATAATVWWMVFRVVLPSNALFHDEVGFLRGRLGVLLPVDSAHFLVVSQQSAPDVLADATVLAPPGLTVLADTIISDSARIAWIRRGQAISAPGIMVHFAVTTEVTSDAPPGTAWVQLRLPTLAGFRALSDSAVPAPRVVTSVEEPLPYEGPIGVGAFRVYAAPLVVRFIILGLWSCTIVLALALLALLFSRSGPVMALLHFLDLRMTDRSKLRVQVPRRPRRESSKSC
jgi:hypothetical protein